MRAWENIVKVTNEFFSGDFELKEFHHPKFANLKSAPVDHKFLQLPPTFLVFST